MIRYAIATVLGGLLLGTVPAVAAPPVPNMEVTPATETVHYRRYRHGHYRHYGYRHYRHYPRYYGYYSYPRYGYYYRPRAGFSVGPLGFYW